MTYITGEKTLLTLYLKFVGPFTILYFFFPEKIESNAIRLLVSQSTCQVKCIKSLILLEKGKLVTEKIKFLTNSLVAKFNDEIRERFHAFPL